MVNKIKLLSLMLSLESCVLGVNSQPQEEKNVSINNNSSSPNGNDEQNVPVELEKFPNPDNDLSPFGFTKLESDPNNQNSVYNNFISNTPLYQIIETKYKFQGQGFYSEYSTNEDLRNSLALDLKPSLEVLASNLNIEFSEELNRTLTDYIVASLSNNIGYDLSHNGFVYFAEVDDKKYLILDGSYLDRNYKVDFVIESPNAYNIIKSTLDQRESDAFE